MENQLGVQDKRNLDRLRVHYPAIYIRYDDRGKPCDQKIARVMDMSSKGVRLQSGFPVDSGEILDITLALGDTLVRFKGKAIRVVLSETHGFEVGISIEDIEDQQRVTLIGFLRWVQSLREA